MGTGNPLDFTGRAVVVTGGTRGIGRSIAGAFLAAGADVVVCGRREPPPLPRADGRSALFHPADVRDPAAAEELVESAVSRYGRLDVLVNNAGGSPDADAATASPGFAERVVALNLLAPYYTARAAHRFMRQQADGGCVINIGSVSAHCPQPGTAAYSAAKAGLLVLTRALALEWGPAVRVNHITAGPVLAEDAVPVPAEDGAPAPGEDGAPVPAEDGGGGMARVVALERLAAPGDIAGACLYLAGPLASYVSGADLAVHGGGELPARYLAARRQLRYPAP
ncbi:SDR family oxidoreductase [Streptomyces sp. NPDC003023]|uniref:SDR family oxidoreductase n=1 Tax=Streptomyces sp. NPDC003023 TaxID=3364675 RepID=UPI0036AB577F